MTVTNDERFRQPTVKRLGMDDGWWFFCPHFLNLKLPLLFVDACLLSGIEPLGLELFGTRAPNSPLRSVDLRAVILGSGVGLYSPNPSPRLVAAHWFRKLTLPRPLQYLVIGIIVGDSYALQLGWSNLWTCRIGTVALVAPSDLWASATVQ